MRGIPTGKDAVAKVFELAVRGGNNTSLRRNITCQLRDIALVPAALALIHCN